MTQRDLIKEVAASLSEQRQDIGLATVLNDLEGWDSLGRLSIAAMLHEAFKLTVDTRTLNGCATVKDIVALVQDRLEE